MKIINGKILKTSTKLRYRDNLRRKFFSMFEVAFSIGLLAVISISFYSTAKAMRNYRKNLLERNSAIFILDNTIERGLATEQLSIEKMRTILEDEFSKSDLSNKPELMPICEIRNGTICLSIIRNDKKVLCEIRLPVKNGGK